MTANTAKRVYEKFVQACLCVRSLSLSKGMGAQTYPRGGQAGINRSLRQAQGTVDAYLAGFSYTL